MNSSDVIDDAEEIEPPKLPFKRLQHALKQVVYVAIPLHVQLLRQQNENIERFQNENKELELRSEQVKATKTVQLLKADLFELEKLNKRVKEEDDDLFNNYIKNATKDAIEILSDFVDLHADIFSPLPETELDFDSNPEAFPPLVCNFNDKSFDTDNSLRAAQGEEAELQLQQVVAAKSNFEILDFLQKELLEINGLIKQFSNFVFRQKENVDTIEANVEQTNQNVFIGTQLLKKASDYKAATFPIAGAVIGALILGPAGALAGFKLFGSVACLTGGSILGYGAGVKLKKIKQSSNEFEMKALAYPTKSLSSSTPNLSLEDSDKKDV